MTQVPPARRPRIGIALGSGSARGWSHIGVLAALRDAGIEPDVVVGTSIGALVGAWYARGHLDQAEQWVRQLTRREVFAIMDLALGGGMLQGRRLMAMYRQQLGDADIETLPLTYAAVATDLHSGQEVWLQEGSLVEAVRASISLPGLFTPVRLNDRWLVDGGLVNPVPVSVCRALGADRVIAVNLNGDLIGRHPPSAEPEPVEPGWWGRVSAAVSDVPLLRGNREVSPGFLDVLASSVNIMQDRITRSRLAGDPPDAVLYPRLGHLELLDFSRGEEAVEEGRATVERALPLLEHLLGVQRREADAPPV